MDATETQELFDRGPDAWNSWVTKMKDQRKELKAEGHWTDGARTNWNQATMQWHEQAKADFSNLRFRSQVRFIQYVFPGDVSFHQTRFDDVAKFNFARFEGNADFSNATFNNICNMSGVTFDGEASFKQVQFCATANFMSNHFLRDVTFDHAKFQGPLIFDYLTAQGQISLDNTAMSSQSEFHNMKCSSKVTFQRALLSQTTWFKRCEFRSDVLFDNCVFENIAFLVDVRFEAIAQFTAVTAKGLFLHNVTFEDVPDFCASNFEEAPQLDNVMIKTSSSGKDLGKSDSQDIPSRWRALKRLAIQGHDYERELQFFAGEIISRRWTQDSWKDGHLWAGYLYQIFCDCGRSIGRPLACLGFSFLLFTSIYFLYSLSMLNEAPLTGLQCRDGTDDAWIAALSLSIHNSIPFARARTPTQVEELYTRLYGTGSESTSTMSSMSSGTFLAVPFPMVVASSIQVLLSSILLFLVALTVRNYFKIK